METSPSIKQIAIALSSFQGAMKAVPKESINPFFKSKYASLESIISATKSLLDGHKLAFAQFPDGDGLTTIIMHESGEWIKATSSLHLKDLTPQGQGSAITYMRRYALSAALGVATEDDDDGNEATKPSQTAKTAPRATKDEKQEEASARSGIALADKKKIADLLKALGKFDKDTVPQTVLDLTGKALIPECVPDIIDRLAALKDEKNNDQ